LAETWLQSKQLRMILRRILLLAILTKAFA